MSKVIATSFEHVSTDPLAPTIATHNDWDLAISKPGEWQVEAQRGGTIVPMRMADYYSPAEAAAYVREQLDWVDSPPPVVADLVDG